MAKQDGRQENSDQEGCHRHHGVRVRDADGVKKSQSGFREGIRSILSKRSDVADDGRDNHAVLAQTILSEAVETVGAGGNPITETRRIGKTPIGETIEVSKPLRAK
jgi:hypothetical protein